MTYPISLYLTLGCGGSRTDFVAGWLGSLPGSINNEWIIDPLTGRSHGVQQAMRNLDKLPDIGPNNLRDYLQKQNWHLDSNAEYVYSGACHGWHINNQICTDDLPAIKIIVIDTTGVDFATLCWEFCVKTFGFYDTRRHAIEYNLPKYHIDYQFKNQIITNQDRCKIFKKQLSVRNNSTPFVNFPHVTIPYKDVISPDGSKRLSELLNIDIAPCYHKLWQTNLEMAKSPDSIDLFGQHWSKTMCESILQ